MNVHKMMKYYTFDDDTIPTTAEELESNESHLDDY
jgi:hypothetical protein